MDKKILIGRRIKELRKRLELSQEKLSERAEITPNYLSRVERGTENPTLDVLIRLADALEVEMFEMFNFGHTVARKDLRLLLNKLVRGADDEELRLTVKVIRALSR